VIIDGHAYCFPPMDSPAGYDSIEEKMAHVQREIGGHHQPAWRVRDRTPADNSALIDPPTGEPHSVTWKRDLGRLVWEYDGETYTKQYVPPMLYNLESTPEMLIREMDYAGVDKAVLHHSAHLGLLNPYLRDAVSHFPDRLTRLIGVKDGHTPGDPDAAIAEVEAEVQAEGTCGFQFFPKFYYLGGHTEPWDGGAMRPFWDAIASMKTPVYFTLVGARVGTQYSDAEREGYLEEQRNLMRWMERYPDVPVVLTHGLPWQSYLEDDRIVLPEEIWEVFSAPQCHMQLLLTIQMGGMWEYPWREADPTIQECVERIGADRLIWGTDMPMVARFCTYRQALDQYGVHCEFLSDGERRSIIGGTVAPLLGISP